MSELFALLRHLATFGPARNGGELEQLLAVIDRLEAARQQATAPDQPAVPAPDGGTQP